MGHGTPLYIRFGDLPTNGHSYDHAHGTSLKGVSVYHACEDGRGIPGIYWPDTGYSHNGGVVESLSERPAYLVTGDRVDGGFGGPDGEPLLANVRIVATLGALKYGGYGVREDA